MNSLIGFSFTRISIGFECIVKHSNKRSAQGLKFLSQNEKLRDLGLGIDHKVEFLSFNEIVRLQIKFRN